MAETSPIESRDALPVASGRAVMVWLWRELRGKRMRVAGILLLFLAEAAAGLIFPVILGFLVDTVIAEVGSGGAGGSSESGHVPTSFWWQLAGLGGAAVASGLLAWAGGAALAKLSETLIAELREAYVKAALNLPRRTVEAAGSGGSCYPCVRRYCPNIQHTAAGAAACGSVGVYGSACCHGVGCNESVVPCWLGVDYSWLCLDCGVVSADGAVCVCEQPRGAIEAGATHPWDTHADAHRLCPPA